MIALAIISIIFLCESWLEQVVILLKNSNLVNYKTWNKAEHFRSAVYAFLIIAAASAYIIVHTKEYWMIPAIAVNRRIFFDYPLILFRGRPANKYEGNDWWAKFLSRIFFGSRIAELIFTIAATIFCIIKTLSS